MEQANATKTIALADMAASKAQLAPVGVRPAFLGVLEADVRALEQSSGAQDAAITQLPDRPRAFCEAKGHLCNAIKDINSAEHGA
jgi:hypothetical protein